MNQVLTPKQKALEINLDETIYGSFAEIGAGQEVVRHFFRAGAAAGTIASAISAYDMNMSDAIYGISEDKRYVSRTRLKRMLEHEYNQVFDRLHDKKKPTTRFFAFANTVAAKAFKGKNPCHGWMGVRFLHRPDGTFSDVTIHLKLKDTQNLAQQESLGIVGVNLIYACFNHIHNHKVFISSLMDNIDRDSIEIDMVEVKGEAFKDVDSRIWSLELVKQNLTDCVLFDYDGKILQASDFFYKKRVIVLRGSFRPPTLVNLDMLESGMRQFKTSLGHGPTENVEDLVVVPEISMHNLRQTGGVEIDNADFLARVDLLSSLGRRVMITNNNHIHCVNEFLMNYTYKEIVFVLGIDNLQNLVNEQRYEEIKGGILGALGSMFGHKTKIYVYPAKDPITGKILRAKDILVPDHLRPLCDYLLINNHIKDLNDSHPELAKIFSREVLSMIKENKEGWEQFVPEIIAKKIKEYHLFR